MANVTPGEDQDIGSTLTLQLYPLWPLLIDYGPLPRLGAQGRRARPYLPAYQSRREDSQD